MWMLEPNFKFGKDLRTGMLALPVVFGFGVVALVRVHHVFGPPSTALYGFVSVSKPLRLGCDALRAALAHVSPVAACCCIQGQI